MKFTRSAFTAVLAFLLFMPSFAQQNEKTKAGKRYEKAVQSYNHDDFAAALGILDEVLEESSNFTKAWLLKGDIYYDLKEFANAEFSYKKAIETDSAFFPPAHFILANLLFEMEKYDEAKLFYQKYLAFHPKIQSELKRSVENMLLCDFRSAMMKNPVPFNPINIGSNVNSSGYEYINALSLDDSQLYFTRKGANPDSDESFFRSVSASGANGQLNFGPAINIGAPINTPGNEGALCVSPDGMTIVITCCSRRDSYGSCDLYLSHRLGNNWSEPENLGPEVNSFAWESQPCLSADGRSLFFVSTRRGGYGGSDIYKSSLRENGEWNLPVNLGDTINTPSDEMAPYIHPDGRTLYFSSKGHPGMGGADLFFSRLGSDNRWLKPENIGYPVNTNHDEINLIINAKGTEAYISAERENGFGYTDIYRFELPQQSRPAPVSYVEGKVYDKNTLKPLAASFELIDMKLNTVVVNSVSDPASGEFIMSLPVDKDYALNVSCKGYLFYSLNFSLKQENDTANPEKLSIPMQAVEVGEKVVLRNIFFETDKFDLLPDSKAELGKLIVFLQKNPALHIEISGHTDNEGSDMHNLALSQNRAQAVFDYLIASGIAAEKLSYKGYGESTPIDGNDTPEGRANNRRTEFKVVKK